MPQPLLIIVTGPPCTGKTTLAREIARQFSLPLVAKDGIKESLGNTLGCADLQESKRWGAASYELLFYFSEAQLAAGRSHIVEGNFFPAHTARLIALRQTYAYDTFQIHCWADEPIIDRRYRVRAESGTRHSVHFDLQRYAELETIRWGDRHPALAIDGPIVELATNNFSTIDRGGLFATIESALRSTDR